MSTLIKKQGLSLLLLEDLIIECFILQSARGHPVNECPLAL
jgi:hypothetical protein